MQLFRKPSYIFLIGTLFIFGLIFSLGIGSVSLFDLDELYFAEITREMMLTGRYSQVTFHFKPLYEKPPLFFWIQAASMHLWGMNEIGARFPNLLCGLLTLCTLYHIGKKYQNSKFGWLWMCLYGSSFLPHFYFKTAIMDPWLNYCLLLSLYFLSFTATGRKQIWLYRGGAGLCMGLALLIKGPIGAVIPVATFALSAIWFSGIPFSFQQLIGVLLIAVTLFACWLVPEIYHNGTVFIKEFWSYHWMLYQQPVATHQQAWYYHYWVLVLGCFPSSLFAIAFFLKRKHWIRTSYFAAAMQAVGVVVLFVFTLVGTKIVHYSSMTYFPITFFAADFLSQHIEQKRAIPRWILISFIGVGTTVGGCLLLLPWLMQHKAWFIDWILNQDILYALETAVVWNCWDSLPGLCYLIGSGIALHAAVKKQLYRFVGSIVCVPLLVLALLLNRIAPKIESYTQKAVVDFCRTHQDQDVYMVPLGFKAAAPHFYTHKSLQNGLKEANLSWLLTGPIDKPCFFILYKSDATLLEPYRDIVCIQSNPGCFAFYQRLPPASG
ncbi:ArnT family glycosyltransferase [Candidatus Cardinium hertigii]|uniref:Undecaprenyl phosphate-alpha-4-amino-4-deoxy-L-arabinose arabinosyl transferase n=1 Tax=Candidatus Cardinium hertigii TaxID=247481 RepID=A0A2Z3LA89_9BACT|nr:glycosyltransferase family 39 protein [Candidatus Cardinium hertigii]AWN82237.1 Undecaprenyl phosphate-alpha-4-amino-4-deoxy-L-arabinose arabinosyl transferase [Candidatus Cardinium hertigii]